MNHKRRSRPIHMDAPLFEFVMLPGHPGVGPNGTADMFGIEIELEGRKIKNESLEVATYWTQHQDNSLRINPKYPDSQAVEYVFQKPFNMKETEKALKIMYKFLNTKGVVVFDSYRTSIHVHINCANDSIRTVVNYITLAMIFDELFVSQNGQTRIGNNFCLRTRDAEGQINDLIQSVTHYGDPCSAIPKNNRYSSVNLASLGKFGSIEFRSLECTTDLDRVLHWVGTLQAMKEAARKYTNPVDIIGAYSSKGPLAFVMHNLGDYGSKYVAVEGYNEMLHTGMRLAQDFAFCSEWLMPDKNEEDIYGRYSKKRPGKKFNVNFAAGVMPNGIFGGVAEPAGWMDDGPMPGGLVDAIVQANLNAAQGAGQPIINMMPDPPQAVPPPVQWGNFEQDVEFLQELDD